MASRVVNVGLLLLVVAACGGTVTHYDAGGSGAAAGNAGAAGVGTAGSYGYGGDIIIGTGAVYDGVGGGYPYGGYGGDISPYGGSAGTYAYGGSSGYGGDAGYGPGGQAGYGGDVWATGGFAGAMDGCPVVPAMTPPPYAFTLKFVSHNIERWLAQDCYLQYTLTACSSGFSAPLNVHVACVATCGSAQGCIVCGACAGNAQLVSPSSSVWDPLDGMVATYHPIANGCSCASYSALPAGLYAVTVPVYGSAANANARVNATTITRYFTLQASGEIVIDLGD